MRENDWEGLFTDLFCFVLFNGPELAFITISNAYVICMFPSDILEMNVTWKHLHSGSQEELKPSPLRLISLAQFVISL